MSKPKIKPVQPDKHWLDPPDWWKKFRPLRIVAILVIVSGAASGLWSGAKLVIPPEHPETARYMAVDPNPVLLIGMFNSYDNIDNVGAKLVAAGYQWRWSKNHRPPSPRYPPRNLDTVKVENFKHLNGEGELTLEFFNDRLYQADFEPKSPQAYAPALHQNEPRLRVEHVGKGEFEAGALRVVTNVDLAGSDVGQSLHTTPYVIWQDSRLLRQRDEWDNDYGAISYHP